MGTGQVSLWDLALSAWVHISRLGNIRTVAQTDPNPPADCGVPHLDLGR